MSLEDKKTGFFMAPALIPIIIQAAIPLVERAIDAAHAAPNNAPQPPISQQVKNSAVLTDVVTNDPAVQEAIQPLPFYYSRTIWAVAVTVLAPLVGKALHYEIDDAQQAAIVDMIMSGIGVLGGAFAIYGRVTARRSISLGRGT